MTNEEFAQNTADDLYNTGLSIENQITLAQVHATLALVEQQRIANEIALRLAVFKVHPHRTVEALNDELVVERLFEAVGLNKKES